MRGHRIAMFICGVAVAVPAFAQDCGGTRDALGVTRVGDAIVFASPHLNVDADGAPDAYRVDGNGLSYTCDGVAAIENGHEVNWRSDGPAWQAKCNAAWRLAKATGDFSTVRIFGFEKDANNRPRVQQVGDPLPGAAYITTTAVEIPEAPRGTQRRYLDASRIPYVVLPRRVVRRHNIKPADIAVVYRPATGKVAFAIYGDAGGLGEGSVKLHFDLGSEPLVLKGGAARAKRRIEDRVITVVFPGHSTERMMDSETWIAQIRGMGAARLTAFGGLARLEACSSKL